MGGTPGTTAALIVAAGRGQRAGGGVPKQYRTLAGRPVIARTLAAFAAHPGVDRLLSVIHPDDAALFAAAAPGQAWVAGGATRADSVRAGLDALAAGGVARVLIHDAARPLVTQALIGRVLAALDRHAGAAPGLALSDALWRGAGGVVTGSVPRDGLLRAQTPQGFRLDAIRAAHAAQPAAAAADDVEVARAAGLDVAIVAGDESNLKITLAEDFRRAERLMEARLDIRTGTGFDVHRFGPGDHVMLCGVAVPHGRGLQGHSDADVAMHAITDALYGALAEGDIGRHFPPSDPQWKGAESHVFLSHAAGLAMARGYAISNIDCTIVCEQPKVGPHAEAMRARLADILGIAAGRIGVKATTSERLGFTGREEGIAALAAVTLVAP